MSNTIEYFRAWNDFEDADADVLKLASTLQSFAHALKTAASDTCFAGVQEAELPALSELVGGKPWCALDFPTPESLQLALRRRWLARARALSLWQAMTSAERNGAPAIRP